MGQLLASPERAQALIDFFQARLDRVAQGVADLAEAEKPGVLVIQYSTEGGEVAFEVPPAEWMRTQLVGLAGGRPLWLEAAQGGGWATVNFEQIALWNPDKIFVIHYQAGPAEAAAALAASPEWQAPEATQNGGIFGFASDLLGWDSPDPRRILGLQWPASKIHPDRFADLDVMQEVRTFCRDVYSMSCESIEADIIPTLKGASWPSASSSATGRCAWCRRASGSRPSSRRDWASCSTWPIR